MLEHDRLRHGALTGLRVLDIGTFIAAPFAATLMGEHGADVVKVELPGVGDHARRLGTASEGVDGSVGDTFVWLSEGRNKRSVTLDLRLEEGAALFLRMVAGADVVVENFQAGTLERWGLGPEALMGVNPRLVVLRITGYGQTGPYAGRPCFGRIANAFGGISFLSGEADRPPAQPGSATLSDYMAGLFGAYAVQLALRARDTTARGQVIDLALYDGIFRILDEVAPTYQKTGFVRQRDGAETPLVAPHSHYPTGDGRWVAIACTNDRIFGRLAMAMGRGELVEDARFATNAARLRHRGEVNGMVADWTGSMDRNAALAACASAEVPCGPVYAIDEIFTDPHYAARGSIAMVDDPRVGPLAVPNLVPQLGGTPGGLRWLGPALGAHTEAVLGELGLDAVAVAGLRARGVV